MYSTVKRPGKALPDGPRAAMRALVEAPPIWTVSALRVNLKQRVAAYNGSAKDLTATVTAPLVQPLPVGPLSSRCPPESTLTLTRGPTAATRVKRIAEVRAGTNSWL